MARPEPRQLQVTRITEVTPNMRRITLGGEGMHDFPAQQTAAYVKLRLAQAEGEKAVVRTYTVRRHNGMEMDVDFALHEDCGPATQWALGAKQGDTILVGGPGPKKLVNPQADWVFLVGDMSALPAISGNIEAMHADVVGHAVIEVVDQADIQKLDAPQGLNIEWVINPHPGQNSDDLVKRVRSIAWREGRVSAWVACEFNAMRQLRDYFRAERGLGPDSLYISSYWKLGSNEDAHRIVKRADMEKNVDSLPLHRRLLRRIYRLLKGLK